MCFFFCSSSKRTNSIIFVYRWKLGQCMCGWFLSFFLPSLFLLSLLLIMTGTIWERRVRRVTVFFFFFFLFLSLRVLVDHWPALVGAWDDTGRLLVEEKYHMNGGEESNG